MPIVGPGVDLACFSGAYTQDRDIHGYIGEWSTSRVQDDTVVIAV